MAKLIVALQFRACAEKQPVIGSLCGEMVAVSRDEH
jgi:hypothetical protein